MLEIIITGLTLSQPLVYVDENKEFYDLTVIQYTYMILYTHYFFDTMILIL